MKNLLKILLLAFLTINLGCSEDDEEPVITGPTESFLPMQIGNYWKFDEENYTEIVDTLRIHGDLYYEFFSLIGGDMVGREYYRIDDDQNLIGKYPNNPYFRNLLAKFDASLGSTFWTLNDQSLNDWKGTVIVKEESIRTFKYQAVYRRHPIERKVTFIKGLGWNNYNEVRINGNIFHF